VDIGSAGPDSVVSASPASSRVILVVALTLAVLCFLGRAFVPADAHKLEDAGEKLDSFLDYSDSLPGSSIDSGLSKEEEVSDVSFHREVETAITRLEQLRLTPEREPCIIQGRTIPGWTAMPVEPSRKPVPAGSNVSGQFDTDTKELAEPCPDRERRVWRLQIPDQGLSQSRESLRLSRQIQRERRSEERRQIQQRISEIRARHRRRREQLANWPSWSGGE
jgi:hypothetical protein